MNDPWGWTKIARPGIIRMPYYDQDGHHMIAAIDRSRRLVHIVRLFAPEDEQRWVPFLEGLLGERDGAA